MQVECSACKTRHRVNEASIPARTAVRWTCKTCQSPILIDGKALKKEEDPPRKEDPATLKARITQSIKDLPLIPQVMVEIQHQLSQMDVNMRQVAQMIETDPGIASKVLRIANSAYYGASGKTSTITQACVILGLRGLSEVVILAGSEKVLSGKLPGYGYDAGDLWKHSLAVAYGSKILANLRDPGISSAAHTAGLLHDIGRIILDPYVGERKSQISKYMETRQKTFLDAEIEHFGFSHAEVAAEVCQAWKFPEFMSTAIHWHHSPGGSNGDLLAHILHMADHIALMGGVGYDDDDILSEVQKDTMSFLQLKQSDLSDILLKVMESVSQVGAS